MDKDELKHYMLSIVENYRGPYTGKINATQLAEQTAWDFGHDEWLDNETHDVWEAAIEVARDVHR